MTTWHLKAIGQEQQAELTNGTACAVGRDPACDLVVRDVTVSRRHAELLATERGLAVRDLGSANGTAINGIKIAAGTVTPGDTVAFGRVVFRLSGSGVGPATGDQDLEGAVVRALPTAAEISLEAQQLARILDLAKKLSGEFELDKLTTAIVDLTFDLLPVDRVSLLLLDETSGELFATRSKSRLPGSETFRAPRSITQRAVADQVPILTESAVDDERFRSGSVMMQSVRGAIATPLLASRDRVLGVLYVDTLTATRPFREDEAGMLSAFAGLAAVSLGKLAFAEEVRREGQVRANFERFFAPEVAARIAREQGSIGLTGERRPVTVLFSDIRGFTALAESMAPDALSGLLTEYFTEMVEVVFAHGGTLDKFIGDAILAVWGAPLAAPGDADRALAGARAMGTRLAALNERSRQHGRPELTIGIGVNYGDVFAGYLGSERRLEYTVIGDTVNVASRLSDAAEPGDILVTETFAAQLAHRPELERIPDLALRNKRRAVAVFRVC